MNMPNYSKGESKVMGKLGNLLKVWHFPFHQTFWSFQNGGQMVRCNFLGKVPNFF